MEYRGGKSSTSVPAVIEWVGTLTASVEPPLDELLDDPIIQLVMESDGVAHDAVTQLIVTGAAKSAVLRH